MEKIFAEIGFGNDTFLSTEIENGEEEYRIPKFLKPIRIDDYYFRMWIFRWILIISTKDGIKLKIKTKIGSSCCLVLAEKINFGIIIIN